MTRSIVFCESTNAKAALPALINQATVVEGHFDDYVPDTI